ncbi:MAG: TolC family protein [Archangium sp.]|nr:TolC family protein [Archangium sp.]
MSTVHPERSRGAIFAVLFATTAFAAPPLPANAAPVPGDLEAAYVATRKPMALAEVLKLADEKSADLAAARAAAAQVAAKARLVFSSVLPEITASVSYVHTTAEQKFDPSAFLQAFEGVIDASIRGAGPAYGFPVQANDQVIDGVKQGFRDGASEGLKPTTIVARNSLYGNLILTQTLFAPQMFLIPAADQSKQAAKYGGLEAREQVLLGVARIYLGVEGLSAIEEAAKDAEKVALKREKDATAQQQMGVATDIAVLRAQSETAQARATLATLQGQKVALLAMLEALVGEPVRPVDGEPTHFEVTASDEAIAPWDGTYLVKANEYGLKAQETFNSFDRLSWLPSLVAQAKGSYNSNKGFAGTNFMFDAVVAAQWTLYDRGQRYVTMHENDFKTVEARAKYEGSRAKAKANWIGAKTNLVAAQVALTQAEAQASLATRAQKQIDSAYQAGFSTSLEVSDIDSKRFFAMSAAAQARAQLEVRKVELAAAEGRLALVLGLDDAPPSPGAGEGKP